MPAPNERSKDKEDLPTARGTGVIFHIKSTDTFMFFLRDDKDWIPFPNMIDIIGGYVEDEEQPSDAIMRELAEELEFQDNGEPFQPEHVSPFCIYVDDRGVEQNIYGCELEDIPRLTLKEGQWLVFLNRDELATTDFAFDFRQVILDYARTV